MLAKTELRAFRGEKIVEVKPVWAHKGEVLERLLASRSSPDFVFAVGDDRTDEHLFERLQSGAWTVQIGPGTTPLHMSLQISRPCAGYWNCLPSPDISAKQHDSSISLLGLEAGLPDDLRACLPTGSSIRWARTGREPPLLWMTLMARLLILSADSVETDRHAPWEEVPALRPATAAISLSMPPKIQRCTG
jgi:Trehalose-phosphatase